MIKMNEFEKDLANVMGSFMEINLDCVEKQNQEIEQLQQENNQLKAKLEMYENGVYYSSENDKLKEVIKEIRKEVINSKEYKLTSAMGLNAKESILHKILQILDKVKDVK